MTVPVAHNLALRDVSKHYGSLAAVDRVSLDVPRGQFLTLLGPSGSGKTTLLMIIAGFVEPSAGDVLVDGARITHLPPERRNFGMVFQGYALFPHLTVFDNVGFPLKVRGMAKAEAARRIRGALDLVQLAPLGERYPRQLSGGQQQRVALARALVFTPHILLLDEPLSALDKKLRAELQWELKQIHHRVGTTFIYVTHDQEEALSMSDQIAIIRDGRIVQSGPPRALYERPATRFVADFLGKSNFIRGRVVALDADRLIYEVGAGRYVQAWAGGAPHRIGDEIVIALRPEKVEIRGAAGAADSANGIAGEIAAWNYHGTSFHVLVATGALGELMVTAPAWRSEVEPEVGRRVHLVWPADAAGVVALD
jgi:putative spermidine/putrescine transport system ATP-binding protein